MRCWDCKKVIILPEVEQERTSTDPTKKMSQVATQEFRCRHCGAGYMQTTARKPGYVKVERAERTEEDIEKGRLWKGE